MEILNSADEANSIATLHSIISNKELLFIQPFVRARLIELLLNSMTERKSLIEENQLLKANYEDLLQHHLAADQTIKGLKTEVESLQIKFHEKSDEFNVVVQKNQMLEQTQRVLMDKEVVGKTPNLIIEMDSLFSLNGDGWKITSHDSDRINKLSQYGLVTAAVLGGIDSGKSFVLNELGGNFDSGFSKQTSAISVSYPEEEGTYLALIDTPGSMEAVQPYNKAIIENFQKNMREEVMEIIDESLAEPVQTDEDAMKKTNEDLEEEHKRRNQLIYSYLHHDRRIIDSLKEKFIIEHADMIFIVVGKLSASESEVIQRSVNYYNELMYSHSAKGNKHLRNKRLYIIHNFKMLQTVEDVERQIQRDIVSCFGLKKAPMFNYSVAKSNEMSRNNYIYSDSQGICHLVLAAKGTPAGDYYNIPAFEFLKKNLAVADLKSRIDFTKAFLEFCQKKLSRILQQELHLIFDTQKSAIVEASKKRIKIGRMYSSELDGLYPADSYVPSYSKSFYENEEETIVVVDIELLDCQFEAKWSKTGGRDYIVLTGEKKVFEVPSPHCVKKTIHSRREGKVSLNIPLLEDRDKPKITKVNLNNGIWRFTVVYPKLQSEVI